MNLFLLRILPAHIYAYFVIVLEKQMRGSNIAAHALVLSKKSALKRGKTYLFNAMNVLYSMSKMSVIADLLAQKPPISKRQMLSCLCVCVFCCDYMCVFVGTKVFTYLQRWSRAHNFEGCRRGDANKMDPIYLIFVVDGRIDPCKKSRNKKHEMKKKVSRVGTKNQTTKCA